MGAGELRLRTATWLTARRLANIRRQPLVSLNFDSNGGDDIVVLTGTAEILDDYPAVPDNPAWLEKYGEAIDAGFGSAVKFAVRFSVPVRVHLARVRGFWPRMSAEQDAEGARRRPSTVVRKQPGRCSIAAGTRS
jgi:hypothetical protein